MKGSSNLIAETESSNVNHNSNISQLEPSLSSNEVLDGPIQFLKGVGPKKAAALKKCGVATVWDALNYFPYRHEDRRKIIHIRDVENGEFVTVYGLVDSIASRRMRNRRTLVQVSIKDASGIIYGVWFNQRWMKDKFKKGQKVLFSGKAQTSPSLQINNPAVEILPEDFFPEDYEGTLIIKDGGKNNLDEVEVEWEDGYTGATGTPDDWEDIDHYVYNNLDKIKKGSPII